MNGFDDLEVEGLNALIGRFLFNSVRDPREIIADSMAEHLSLPHLTNWTSKRQIVISLGRGVELLLVNGGAGTTEKVKVVRDFKPVTIGVTHAFSFHGTLRNVPVLGEIDLGHSVLTYTLSSDFEGSDVEGVASVEHDLHVSFIYFLNGVEKRISVTTSGYELPSMNSGPCPNCGGDHGPGFEHSEYAYVESSANGQTTTLDERNVYLS